MLRSRSIQAFWGLMVLMALSLGARIQASEFECYLEMDGLEDPGNSPVVNRKEKKKPGEIKGILLRTTSFDSSNAAHSSGGGGGAGKVQVGDIKLEFDGNEYAPQLFIKQAVGEHQKKATITYYKMDDGKPVKYFQITLEDVLITSFSFANGNGEEPSTQVSLNFAKITLQQGTGAKVSFDVKSNKKI